VGADPLSRGTQKLKRIALCIGLLAYGLSTNAQVEHHPPGRGGPDVGIALSNSASVVYFSISGKGLYSAAVSLSGEEGFGGDLLGVTLEFRPLGSSNRYMQIPYIEIGAGSSSQYVFGSIGGGFGYSADVHSYVRIIGRAGATHLNVKDAGTLTVRSAELSLQIGPEIGPSLILGAGGSDAEGFTEVFYTAVISFTKNADN